MGRTAWAHIVSLIEVKSNPDAAPFNFDAGPFTLNDSPEFSHLGSKSRAQAVSYATEIQRRQHRVFAFTAFIQGHMVCLMRWDRAGVLVSEAFNYLTNPEPLLRFFYLMAKHGPEAQGYDPAFSPAAAYAGRVDNWRKTVDDSSDSANWSSKYSKYVDHGQELYPMYSVCILILIPCTLSLTVSPCRSNLMTSLVPTSLRVSGERTSM